MSNYDTSIRSIREELHADSYIEVCNCFNPERVLCFDVTEKSYYGIKGCNCEFACAKLQINKHKIILTSRKRRLLDPNFDQTKKLLKNKKSPYDRTLDQFFGK